MHRILKTLLLNCFNIIFMFLNYNLTMGDQKLSEIMMVATADKPQHHVTISQAFKSRLKRNVAELGYLVDTYTPYTSTQLLKHGNWCGFGGNRRHDGSVVDECDACCKRHDACYNNLLEHTSEPLQDAFFELGIPIFNKFSFRFKRRRCVPYIDTYKVAPGLFPHCQQTYGYCAQEACNCDIQFIQCLKNSYCRTF